MLSTNKSRDLNSFRKLKNSISSTGYKVRDWVLEFNNRNKFYLTDSFLAEYATQLYNAKFVPHKPPREIYKYKFILYAWIQNEWEYYSQYFNMATVVKPSNNLELGFTQNYDIQDITGSIKEGLMDIGTAASIINHIEYNKIKYILFFLSTDTNFIFATYLLNKKHKTLFFRII